MFYTQLFTSKRGSLAKIWLAAHWERKLTKTHVFECNLETTIREIISPKMTIGLRTSGHLLIGVVRIYSRKAKYLLADCSEALLKVKTAFRPGQTDMTVKGLEATVKAITLIEDFTTFDSPLPDPSDIDVAQFSLNQSRPEEITLKEDFGKSFLIFEDTGDECKGLCSAVLDVNIQSFAQHGDAFGDEDQGFDLLDFLMQSDDNATDFILEEPQNENLQNSPLNDQRDANRRDSMEAETPATNQTTLFASEGEAFALEPVPITPNPAGKKGKRKRKLVVDQTKELTNNYIREQLSDFADVLFAKSFFKVKCCGVHEDVEEMRQEEQNVQSDLSAFAADISVVDSSADPEKTHTELTECDGTNQHESYSQLAHDENRSEFTHPSLPSEDSMFVHPSYLEHSTQATSLHTQSMLNSQDFEERRITRRAQKLLNALKQSRSDSSDPAFSLQTLCEGGNRWQAATNFFCLLILKKQHVLRLRQRAPYDDIFATPGPRFYN